MILRSRCMRSFRTWTQRTCASPICTSGSRSWTGSTTIPRNRTKPNWNIFRWRGWKSTKTMRKVFVFAFAIGLFAADPKLTPEMQTVMNHITADSLRGHLSFIASDALEGRGTPSRGLDLAAEYIAAQFRRAGLEPAGDDQYFQTATLMTREQNPEGYEFTVISAGKTIQIPASEVAIFPEQPIRLDNAPVVVKPNSITVGPIELMRARAVRSAMV